MRRHPADVWTRMERPLPIDRRDRMVAILARVLEEHERPRRLRESLGLPPDPAPYVDRLPF